MNHTVANIRNTPRFGLCCALVDESTLKFRTTTAAHLARLQSANAVGAAAFYSELVIANLRTLVNVLHWCAANDVKAFRINSDLWPRATHPLVAPWIDALFESAIIAEHFQTIRTLARQHDIRLSEHPDQFLVGNSLRDDVVDATLRELQWRGKLGEALGVDVICLHVGSGLPDRDTALWRWEAALARLSPAVLQRLAFENDDRTFSPQAILPACLAWNVPMVYDAHHHRVLPDELTEAEATDFAIASWGDREPYFHLSSPRAGWHAGDTRPHNDYINPSDWPAAWTELWNWGFQFTVDMEAKAKERAVFRIRDCVCR